MIDAGWFSDVVFPMKPHLHKRGKVWWCMGQGRGGAGRTALEAYNNWRTSFYKAI